MSKHGKSHLPRLDGSWYQGAAFVFWTHTLEQRSIGWLDPSLHLVFREIMLHVLARYQLICPVYCLMPDHFHLIWMGLGSESDQLLANRFFRRSLNARLAPFKLQPQAYDHVLRDEERERDALAGTCRYILENPLRANLCSDRAQYAYMGGLAVGYPDFDPRTERFWDRFWEIYYTARSHSAPP